MLKRIVLMVSFLSVVGATAPSFAQADLVEIMRSDLRTQKRALLTQALQLTEAQSEAFWPVYNEYESELIKLNDSRLTLIKDFASNYSTMTDPVAKDLVKRSFKWQEGSTKLLKKYYGKMEKVVSPIVAARWVQAEHAINSMIDVQVASEIPLIQ